YAGGLFGGSTGFSPDLVVLNGQALFSGLDAACNLGIWVSNGTAAGTHELTGIIGANTGEVFLGASPGFAVFNGEALFQGKDAAGISGLWATDGTAAGTHEIMGALNPSDLTVFNGEVLFAANDAANQTGLWVTNGTAAGTHELTGISGAFTGPGGLFGG